MFSRKRTFLLKKEKKKTHAIPLSILFFTKRITKPPFNRTYACIRNTIYGLIYPPIIQRLIIHLSDSLSGLKAYFLLHFMPHFTLSGYYKKCLRMCLCLIVNKRSIYFCASDCSYYAMLLYTYVRMHTIRAEIVSVLFRNVGAYFYVVAVTLRWFIEVQVNGLFCLNLKQKENTKFLPFSVSCLFACLCAKILIVIHSTAKPVYFCGFKRQSDV